MKSQKNKEASFIEDAKQIDKLNKGPQTSTREKEITELQSDIIQESPMLLDTQDEHRHIPPVGLGVELINKAKIRSSNQK